MNTKLYVNFVLASGAALALSGCVAAAIPIVAGGAVMRSATDGKDAGDKSKEEVATVTVNEETPAPVEPRPATSSAVPANPPVAAKPAEPLTAGLETAATEAPAIATPTPASSEPVERVAKAEIPEALPPRPRPSPPTVAAEVTMPAPTPVVVPDPAPIAAKPSAPVAAPEMPPSAVSAPPRLAAPPALPAPNPYVAFIRYAKDKSPADPGPLMPDAKAPVSAVLRDPVALDGRRRACMTNKSTVVIDLDPEGGQYSPDMPLKNEPDLMLGLGELRANGVKVAWVSSASAAYAGDLRMALRSSGLDALARDELLLMRYPDDRKQTRLEALASETCLIAIAGDERADFDERFKYLRNPEDARGLDALIGNGWFLVPSLAEEKTPASTPSASQGTQP